MYIVYINIIYNINILRRLNNGLASCNALFLCAQVTGVTRPSSYVGVYPGRITWTLNDAGVSIRGNWRYDYNVWQINFGDSGSFTGSASGGSISISASLGLQYTGHPTISGSGCSCSISSVSIRLSGGASWLYNLFIDHVERPVRDHLQSKICEAATNILNGNASRLLTSFPIQRTVATDYLFDYHFLSAPHLQSGFMDTKHKAAFYYRGDRTEAPIQVEMENFMKFCRVKISLKFSMKILGRKFYNFNNEIRIIIVGRGGALVDSISFDRRVMGSNAALAAT